jgi:hypothetical protein
LLYAAKAAHKELLRLSIKKAVALLGQGGSPASGRNESNISESIRTESNRIRIE